jgi:DNA-binding NarL/FixJ family response regulator
MSTTVVIVDDDAGFRRRARQVLVAGGFDVVGEAGDVASADLVVGRLQPEAVVVDVQLPDGDGFDVVDRLLAGGGQPKIVLMSGRDRGEYGARVTGCGALGFMDKLDLNAATLRELLQEGDRP